MCSTITARIQGGGNSAGGNDDMDISDESKCNDQEMISVHSSSVSVFSDESSKSSTDDVAEFTIDSEHLDPNTNIVASSIRSNRTINGNYHLIENNS